MNEQELVEAIVSFREIGMTWKEIEAVLFPDSNYIKTGRGNRDSWNLAAKYKNGIAAGAYSKAVIGCFGPTQIVVPLRKFKRHEEKRAALTQEKAFVYEG